MAWLPFQKLLLNVLLVITSSSMKLPTNEVPSICSNVPSPFLFVWIFLDPILILMHLSHFLNHPSLSLLLQLSLKLRDQNHEQMLLFLFQYFWELWLQVVVRKYSWEEFVIWENSRKFVSYKPRNYRWCFFWFRLTHSGKHDYQLISVKSQWPLKQWTNLLKKLLQNLFNL